jgi:hypothetical protein
MLNIPCDALDCIWRVACSPRVPAGLTNGVVELLHCRLVGALADRPPAIADRGKQLRPCTHPLPAGLALHRVPERYLSVGCGYHSAEVAPPCEPIAFTRFLGRFSRHFDPLAPPRRAPRAGREICRRAGPARGHPYESHDFWIFGNAHWSHAGIDAKSVWRE